MKTIQKYFQKTNWDYWTIFQIVGFNILLDLSQKKNSFRLIIKSERPLSFVFNSLPWSQMEKKIERKRKLSFYVTLVVSQSCKGLHYVAFFEWLNIYKYNGLSSTGNSSWEGKKRDKIDKIFIKKIKHIQIYRK